MQTPLGYYYVNKEKFWNKMYDGFLQFLKWMLPGLQGSRILDFFVCSLPSAQQ